MTSAEYAACVNPGVQVGKKSKKGKSCKKGKKGKGGSGGVAGAFLDHYAVDGFNAGFTDSTELMSIVDATTVTVSRDWATDTTSQCSTTCMDRIVEIEVEYKPESPADRDAFLAAANRLADAGWHSTEYCGCTTRINVRENHDYQFNHVGPNAAKKGKCKGAYKEGKKNSFPDPLPVQSAESKGSSLSKSSGAVIAVGCAVVVVAAVALFAQRRIAARASDDVFVGDAPAIVTNPAAVSV